MTHSENNNINSNINNSILVLKYGGATLATPEKIKQAALRISELHQSGIKVVAVVSAMGNTTNELIDLALKVSERPQLREMDMLLSVGERISMSLMSMALNDLGCPAISLTGSQAGIMTDESHVNANIIDVKAYRVEQSLKDNKVVIMAGFQGVSPLTKEITTLGRGGSDTSAVAMAGYLNAYRCEILKDVDGVFTADPKIIKNAKIIHHLNYHQLLEMTQWGAKVLHHRSVHMAQSKNVSLYVGPAGASRTNELLGTFVDTQFQFSEKKPLALNTFVQVLKIKLLVSLNEFNQALFKFQLSKPQFLLKDNEEHYFSGPTETLAALIKFDKNNPYFEILETNLSSISLTYTQMTADSDLDKVNNLIKEKNISILKSFILFHSIHIILQSSQRIELMQLLHDLIE